MVIEVVKSLYVRRAGEIERERERERPELAS